MRSLTAKELLANEILVPLAGIEPALLAELDFESSALPVPPQGPSVAGLRGRCGEAGGI